ncbi:MAG: monovalent cation/H+ antiporter complex subunit F [Oscillospiraceae bacterium]|nr:monovalent cation/H+ antiporter complex subunit F [Oscillospiraceae bacterium]
MNMFVDFFSLSCALFFLIFLLLIRFIKGAKFSDKLLALQYIELFICVFVLILGSFSENDVLINIGFIFSILGFVGIIFLNRLAGDKD